MSQDCGLAERDQIRAVYVQHRLIIWARGKKPTPCHTVEVRQSPLRIFPPQYEIRECTPAGAKCIQVVTEYTATGTFHGLPAAHVTVHHRDGSDDVPVTIIDDPIGSPAAGLAALDAGASAGGGGSALGPLRLGQLLETGDPSGIQLLLGERVEATGYSNSFSFDEAFQDAVGNLPPDPNPFPDKLISVTVDRIGAEYGGFAGFHRMVVQVSTRY